MFDVPAKLIKNNTTKAQPWRLEFDATVPITFAGGTWIKVVLAKVNRNGDAGAGQQRAWIQSY